jgi:hypothetical protein
MTMRLVPGTANVWRFPAERCARPTIELIRQLAPTRSSVATILEERNQPPEDVESAFARQTLRQMLLLEVQLGPDRTVLHMRAALEAHLAQAAEACWRHLDAADRMVAIEIEAEDARARTPWRRSNYGQLLAQARADYRDGALAARGSANAALGVAAAIAAYVRSRIEAANAETPQLALPLAMPMAIAG